MAATCDCTGKKNLDPLHYFVVEAAQFIKQTHGCVGMLAGRILAQDDKAPALAASWPALPRAERQSEEERRNCRFVVGNRCKPVEDPAEVLPPSSGLEPLAAAVAGVGRRGQAAGGQGCAGHFLNGQQILGLQNRGVDQRKGSVSWLVAPRATRPIANRQRWRRNTSRPS